MTRTPTRSLLLLLLAAGVAVAGCRGGRGQVALEEGATSEPPPTTATTASPSTTAAAPTSATTRLGRGAAAKPTATAVRRTTTTARSAPPKVVVPQQGQRVVAVFVATGASLDEPAFTRAKARLNALGYRGYSGGDTGCSRGAKEALPQLEEYSLSLEFATRADAERFAALYGDVLGIASVNVYCAD